MSKKVVVKVTEQRIVIRGNTPVKYKSEDTLTACLSIARSIYYK